MDDDRQAFFRIYNDGGEVGHGSMAEFLQEYLKAEDYWFEIMVSKEDPRNEFRSSIHSFEVKGIGDSVKVTVQLPTSQDVAAILSIFERDKGLSILPTVTEKERKIFIGHGHDE